MPDTYPPERHVLRDLRFEFDRPTPSDLVVRLPLVPEILDELGGVRAGVLGIAVDIFGGNLSIAAARPDWAVTSELGLHILRPVRKGPVEVRGDVLRSGRTSVVLEARVSDGEEGLAALGSMSFTRIERRSDNPEVAEQRPANTTFAAEGSGLRAPLLDVVGVRDVAGQPGSVELDLVPYVMNSVNALQGGLVTTLIEVAAERAARQALRRPVATTDFAIHFLALGKKGPLRAHARVLRVRDEQALLRVELRDLGQADRLLSVATASAGPLGMP